MLLLSGDDRDPCPCIRSDSQASDASVWLKPQTSCPKMGFSLPTLTHVELEIGHFANCP